VCVCVCVCYWIKIMAQVTPTAPRKTHHNHTKNTTVQTTNTHTWSRKQQHIESTVNTTKNTKGNFELKQIETNNALTDRQQRTECQLLPLCVYVCVSVCVCCMCLCVCVCCVWGCRVIVKLI